MIHFDNFDWLNTKQALERFGYAHPNSLSFRLRQLRKQGKVMDLGSPPSMYTVHEHDSDSEGKVVIMWLNSQTALIRSDAPMNLLNAKPGRR